MIPFEIRVYMNKHPESLVEKDGSRVVTVPGLMRREYVSCPDLRHDGVLCHYFNGDGVPYSAISKGGKDLFACKRTHESSMIDIWNGLGPEDTRSRQLSLRDLDSFLESLVFDGGIFVDIDEDTGLSDKHSMYGAYRFGIQSTLLALGFDSEWILSEVLRRLDLYVKEERANRLIGLDDPRVDALMKDIIEIRYDDSLFF